MENTEEVKPKAKLKRIKKKSTKKKSLKKATTKKGAKNKIKIFPKLKYWLIEKGISQIDLCEKTAYTPNTMNRLVNTGKASKPVLVSVSRELKITMEKMTELLEPNQSIDN